MGDFLTRRKDTDLVSCQTKICVGEASWKLASDGNWDRQFYSSHMLSGAELSHKGTGGRATDHAHVTSTIFSLADFFFLLWFRALVANFVQSCCQIYSAIFQWYYSKIFLFIPEQFISPKHFILFSEHFILFSEQVLLLIEYIRLIFYVDLFFHLFQNNLCF